MRNYVYRHRLRTGSNLARFNSVEKHVAPNLFSNHAFRVSTMKRGCYFHHVGLDKVGFPQCKIQFEPETHFSTLILFRSVFHDGWRRMAPIGVLQWFGRIFLAQALVWLATDMRGMFGCKEKCQATRPEWKTAAGSCKVCCSAVTSANAIAGGPLGPVVSVVPSAFRGGGADFFF